MMRFGDLVANAPRLYAQVLPGLDRGWRRGRRIFLVLAAGLALTVATQWWPGSVERVITPDEIRPLEGHAFYVEPLGLTAPWLFAVWPDTNHNPTVSTLIVREDARELTPHSLHATIVAEGRGAYSHWGNGLQLSASDNSDPRTNGRRYSVRATFAPRERLFLLLWAVLLLAALDISRTIVPKLAMRATMAGAGTTSSDWLAGARVLCLAVALTGTAYFGYAWLLDPVDAMELARKAAIRLAMSGVYAAIGAVAVIGLQRRDWKSWRLAVALAALAATGVFLFLRAEVYAGNRLLPSGPSVFVPLIVGALGGYAVGFGIARRRYEEFWATAGAHRRALTLTIIVVLCLAAPMIWSPVVEHWNSSGWMDSHGYDTYAHNIITGKVPEGSSQYMPVYQYGMAAVYYLFGHFFFAQQLVNAALAFVTVLLICLSAWNLYRNLWAVLLIGVWAAFARQMVYAVFFTQIESWYMPIVALGIFAWTSYWRTPSAVHLVLLAVAAGIGINTRNQGAFYFGWLCLAPLVVAALPWRRRFLHAAIAVAILAASLVPWSLRNYVVDGRLSPSSARNAIYLGILNDPRIGFYGVRYWEGWEEITADYVRRYPDPVERDRAMSSAGLRRPFEDPGWFQRAMFWRALAFYGVLPPGKVAPEGPKPTNWSTEWRGFVYWRMAPLMLLSLSFIALVTRFGRTTFFLAVAAAANVATSALTGGAEDRVSYPVLLIHMLMGLAAIFQPYQGEAGWRAIKSTLAIARPRTWVVAAAALVLFLGIARDQFGRPNMYAPLLERGVFLNSKLELDETLPSLNDFASTTVPPPALPPDWEGRSVRLRLMALNYQCPPKYGGRIGYVPDFATDPGSETYYYATLLIHRDGRLQHLSIAVAWAGATLTEPLREGDEIEAEGRLRLANGNQVAPYWVRIEKARKVSLRSSEIPPFS